MAMVIGDVNREMMSCSWEMVEVVWTWWVNIDCIYHYMSPFENKIRINHPSIFEMWLSSHFTLLCLEEYWWNTSISNSPVNTEITDKPLADLRKVFSICKVLQNPDRILNLCIILFGSSTWNKSSHTLCFCPKISWYCMKSYSHIWKS